MTRHASVTFDYACPPQMVWDINTHVCSFARLMARVATFEGMPTSGQIQQGQVFDVTVRTFGWMPPMPYRMELLECDHAAMRFRSREAGGPVTRWDHVSTVEATANGCRLTDSVEVEAGLITPLMPFWIRYVYRSRHKPRLALIAERAAELPKA